MQENFNIDKAAKETTEFVRDKADVAMFSMTKTLGNVLAKTLIKIISIFLILIAFLFANVALGLAIGKWLDIHSFYGLLIVAAGYVVIVLLLILFSPLIKLMIRNMIARKGVEKVLELNDKLDKVLPKMFRRDSVNTEFQDKKKKSKITYKRLESMEAEALAKSQNGKHVFDDNIKYVKSNFKSIVLGIAKNKAVSSLYKNKYIGTFLSFIGIENDYDNYNDKNNFQDSNIRSRKGIAAKKYKGTSNKWLSLATTVGSSLLWSMFLSRTKRALIRRIIPFGRKKKKKKSLIGKIMSIF